MQKNHKEPVEINTFRIEKLICLTRAIGHIIYIRDITKNKIFAKQEIKIDSRGHININRPDDFDQIFKNLRNIFFETKIKRKDYPIQIEEESKDKINLLCRIYLGFDTKDVLNFNNMLFSFYSKRDEFLIGTIQYFEKLAESILGPDIENNKAFIKNFYYSPIILNYYDATIKKGNRMLRKCLIPVVDDIIACPVSILKFATMGLYLDILERKIENEPLKRELQKVYEQIDKNFEKRVCQEIINELSAKARNNVYKIPIRTTARFVTLPNEIDVLALYAG